MSKVLMSVNDFFRDSVISTFSVDNPPITIIRENQLLILLIFLLILQLVILCKKPSPVNVVINVDCVCQAIEEEVIEIE